MEHDGSLGRMLHFCEWIMRFAYTNLLWLFFTLLGLGVFGIMPATAALFAVMRKWIQGQDNVPVLKTFWQEYKGEFFRSNLLGAVLALIGVIIYIDLAFHLSKSFPSAHPALRHYDIWLFVRIHAFLCVSAACPF